MIEASYSVRVDRNIRIPVRDGTHLSADLIRPDVNGSFPMVLEYHPYRKDDVSRVGLDAHWYFAERGFIGVRLDARGTGSSEGINTDEYRPIEQQDGYDAIEWLACQDFSNGNIGMFGTSYGGFTAIQVAVHQPPHLKAIVPMYATDDRYADDCHYTRGGNMRMYYDVGTYGGSMIGMNALPPDPELFGNDWQDEWTKRLENNPPYLLNWMKHQTDGEYWRRASLRPDYDRVQCPVFHIAGWHDGYVNAQLRAFANTTVPKKILVGPWVHTRPNVSVPGPRIDYLQEVVRFFAYWLRDEDTGVMDEPPVTVYLQHSFKPDRTRDEIPGLWRDEQRFPAEEAGEICFQLSSNGRLQTVGIDDGANLKPESNYVEIEHDPTVGTQNRFWSAGGITYYLAEDQRADEARSLTWTTPPFEDEMHLLGWPRVVVHASSSAKVATFVAKISDVAPDGASSLIGDGSINGTRRNSLDDPQPMIPHEVYELEIPMMPTGWIIQPGHRIRLAISTSDFPNLWPTPQAATNRIYFGGKFASYVTLPIVPISRDSSREFLPAPQLYCPVTSRTEQPTQQVVQDHTNRSVTLVNRVSTTITLEDQTTSMTRTGEFRCTATSDPANASIIGTHTYVWSHAASNYKVIAATCVKGTAEFFNIKIDLSVSKDDEIIFTKQWTADERRQLL